MQPNGGPAVDGDRPRQIIGGGTGSRNNQDVAASGLALDEDTRFSQPELCCGGFEQADHVHSVPGRHAGSPSPAAPRSRMHSIAHRLSPLASRPSPLAPRPSNLGPRTSDILLLVLFATTSLAARVERAECAMAVAFGEFAKVRRADALIAPVGGAAAVYGGPGEPFNKLAGLGFAPLDEHALAEVEREFDARQAPLQVEFAALADLTIATALARRGYHLVNFEHVLGLALTPAAIDRASAEYETHAESGISVRRTAASESALWIDAVTTGFAHADVFDGPPSHELVRPRNARTCVRGLRPDSRSRELRGAS